MTVPYSPLQNGVTEWMNWTLGELSHAMLTASKLPEFLWQMAVAYAAYIRNMSFTKAILSATLYQVWHGQRPNVAHVGYNKGVKAVKYYNAETKTILTL